MDRAFETDLSPELTHGILLGSLRTLYRGQTFAKSPFDVILYLQLIQKLKPRTIIEIGSWTGGSALWFADMMELHGLEPRVVSVDVEIRADFTDPRIRFVAGDALALGKVLDAQMLATLPKPWLVSEDSSHYYETTIATLNFFDPFLESGDYLVVEDGCVGLMGGEIGQPFKDGPNRAVRDFMGRRGDTYAVDEGLCDFFGRNVTFNPNGWLRRL